MIVISTDCTYRNISLDIPLYFTYNFYSVYLIKEQDSEVSQRYFGIKFWVLVLFSSSSSLPPTQCKCPIRTVTPLCCIVISASNYRTAQRLIHILKYLRSFWHTKHQTLWISAYVFCQACRFCCTQPLNVAVQSLWGHLTSNSDRCKKEA